MANSRDARDGVPGPDAEGRPLRLVEQIPGSNLRRVAVVGKQGRDDVVQQVRAQVGMRDQPAAAPGLDAIDDPSRPAQVEVEQHGHQRHVGPAYQIEGDVEVAPCFALNRKRRAVLAKPDAGASVAQEEPPQARDPCLAQPEQHVEHTLLIGRSGSESALRRPGVGAEVAAVADPRQVRAQNEAHPATGDGEAGRLTESGRQSTDCEPDTAERGVQAQRGNKSGLSVNKPSTPATARKCAISSRTEGKRPADEERKV